MYTVLPRKMHDHGVRIDPSQQKRSPARIDLTTSNNQQNRALRKLFAQNKSKLCTRAAILRNARCFLGIGGRARCAGTVIVTSMGRNHRLGRQWLVGLLNSDLTPIRPRPMLLVKVGNHTLVRGTICKASPRAQ